VPGLLWCLAFSRGFSDVIWWVGYLTTLYVLTVMNLIEFVDLERWRGKGASVVARLKAASRHLYDATEENHKVVCAVAVGLPFVCHIACWCSVSLPGCMSEELLPSLLLLVVTIRTARTSIAVHAFCPCSVFGIACNC
jgi:hypothetical protein